MHNLSPTQLMPGSSAAVGAAANHSEEEGGGSESREAPGSSSFPVDDPLASDPRFKAWALAPDPWEEVVPFSLGVLSKENALRRVCGWGAFSKGFALAMGLVVFLNAVFLAMYDPVADRFHVPSVRNDIIAASELFFQVTYTVEMLIMIVAKGLVWEGPNTYLRSAQGLFDFVVVTFGWVAVYMDAANPDNNLAFLRAVRVLRPLRGLRYVPGLESLYVTINRSYRIMANVWVLFAFITTIFTLMGQALFLGKLHQRCGWQDSRQAWHMYADTMDRFCSTDPGVGFQCPNATVADPLTGAPRPVSCQSVFPAPNAGLTGFDNFFQGFLTVFVIATLEGWADVMYWYSDTSGSAVFVYFLCLIIFCAFVVLSLVVAVLTVNYNAAQEEARDAANNAELQSLRESLEAEARKAYYARQRSARAFLGEVEMRLMYSWEMHVSGGGGGGSGGAVSSPPVSPRTTYSSSTPSPRPSGPLTSPTFKSNPFLRTNLTSPRVRGGGEEEPFSPRTAQVLDETPYNTMTEVLYNQYKAKHSAKEYAAFVARIKKSASKRRRTTAVEGPILFRNLGRRDRNTMPVPEFPEPVPGMEDNQVATVPLGGGEGDRGPSSPPAQALASRRALQGGASSSLPGTVPDEDLTPAQLVAMPIGAKPNAPTVCTMAYMFITHPFTEAVVFLAIFYNTLVLASAHFMEPEWLVHAQEVSNLVLTIFFTVEMVIRLVGYGPSAFVRDGFAMFDFLIVVTSWIDIGLSGDSSTLVFRMLRLFRIFKLAKTWKSLRHMLITIVKTLRGMYSFGILLMIFFYVFTVSGLMLYGGYISLSPFVQDPTTLLPMPNPDWSCTQFVGGFYTPWYVHCPDWSNYDTFLWSFVTSFQILTKENWNELMYSTAAALGTWTPALYYVAVIVVGSFLVLNLFLAILIDAFLDTQRELKEQKKKEDRMRRLRRRLLRWPSRDKVSGPSVGGGGGGSQGAESDGDHGVTPSVSAPPGTVVTSSDDGGSEGGQNLHTWANQRLHELVESNRTKMLHTHPAFASKSLGCISPSNRVRIVVGMVLEHPLFDNFIICVILLACVLLVLGSNYVAASPGLSGLNTAIDCIFIIEAGLKMFAFGVVMHQGAYLRDPWNILDFFIVVTSIIALAASSSELAGFRAFRALRPLRLVSKFESTRITITALGAAILPVSQIAALFALFNLIFAILAVQLFGGQLFSCRLCTDYPACTNWMDSPINVDSGLPLVNRSTFPYWIHASSRGVSGTPLASQCLGGPQALSLVDTPPQQQVAWRNPVFTGMGSGATYSFDNAWSSFLILYEISSTELWLDVMAQATTVRGIGHATLRGSSDVASLFFVAYMLVMNFFILQLFVASVIDTFTVSQGKVTGDRYMTRNQVEWVKLQAYVFQMPPKPKRFTPSSNLVRFTVFKIVNHRYFMRFVLTAITANTITLGVAHYQESPQVRYVLDILDYVFGAVYITEAVLRIVAYGVHYFTVPQNLFDFFIVVIIILGWILGDNLSVGVSSLEVLRAFRLTLLFETQPSLKALLKTMSSVLPAMFNILVLMFLLIFIYAALGTEFFANMETTGSTFASATYANFDTFGASFITLFRASTGESWTGLMHDYAAVNPVGSYLFFFTYTILSQYVFLNLFVAVILSSFTSVLTKSSKEYVAVENLVAFQHVWARLADAHFDEFVKRLMGQVMPYRSKWSQQPFSFGDQHQHQHQQSPAGALAAAPAAATVAPSLSAGLGVSTPRASTLLTAAANAESGAADLALVESRMRALAAQIVLDDELPDSYFRRLVTILRPPLGLSHAGQWTDAEFYRALQLLQIPITKTMMIHYQGTLSALLNQAMRMGNQAKDLAKLDGTLRVAMMKRNPISILKRESLASRVATSHSVAQAVAVRKIQKAVRYTLKLRGLRQDVRVGRITPEEAVRLRDRLRIEYLVGKVVGVE